MPSQRLAWEAELLHAVAQGGALEAQAYGGTVRPADHLLVSRSICVCRKFPVLGSLLNIVYRPLSG
jgi:hypothetical protein